MKRKPGPEPRIVADTPRLRIMHGGPFFDLQKRIGLIPAEGYGTVKRVFLLLALTFVLPVLAAAAFSHTANLQAFLADPGVWAKFVFGPLLFVLAEPRIEASVDRCVANLFSIPLVSKQGKQAATAAVRRAVARRNSQTAEGVCMLMAAIITAVNISVLASSPAGAHWASAEGSLVPAAWVSLLIGNTVFWFLMLRVVWRHLIWAAFSSDVARSGLRLVASHPDGHAGLSFMSHYTGGYTFFSLGAGSMVAAGLAHQLHGGGLTLTAFTAVCTIWLAIVALFFILPLIVPIQQIIRMKADTIALTLKPMQDFERAAERKVLGRNAFAEDAGPEPVTADAKPTYLAAVKCSSLLLNKSNIVPILAGALLPIAAVGLTVFPYSDLVPILKKLLLL